MRSVLIRSRARGLVDPASASAEPFRALRISLDLRRDSRKGNAVLFTSAEARSGKSLIAANFALVSSYSQSSVLLIDGDLRRPVQHETFAVHRSPGIVELLASGERLAAYVQPAPAADHLDVLTSGRPMPGATDLTSSSRMGAIIGEARRDYDVVVIDSPPIQRSIDAAGLASFEGVDVVLVTTPKAGRRSLVKAVRKLDQLGANVAGVAMNREGTLSTYSY